MPVAPCSPCQSRRRATEQRETSQTAGQRRPDGGLGTEGRRVWRGGAGGDKLIGLSIDLEELHSASRALEARVDEALAGNQELQSYVQRLDSGLVDEDQEPPDELHSLTEPLLCDVYEGAIRITPLEGGRPADVAAGQRGVLASARAPVIVAQIAALAPGGGPAQPAPSPVENLRQNSVSPF